MRERRKEREAKRERESGKKHQNHRSVHSFIHSVGSVASVLNKEKIFLRSLIDRVFVLSSMNSNRERERRVANEFRFVFRSFHSTLFCTHSLPHSFYRFISCSPSVCRNRFACIPFHFHRNMFGVTIDVCAIQCFHIHHSVRTQTQMRRSAARSATFRFRLHIGAPPLLNPRSCDCGESPETCARLTRLTFTQAQYVGRRGHWNDSFCVRNFLDFRFRRVPKLDATAACGGGGGGHR